MCTCDYVCKWVNEGGYSIPNSGDLVVHHVCFLCECIQVPPFTSLPFVQIPFPLLLPPLYLSLNGT